MYCFFCPYLLCSRTIKTRRCLFSIWIFTMRNSDELAAHVAERSAIFKGQLPELSQAIGALYLGKLYGWKVLRITMSSKTYSRHQHILALDFKDEMPEEGDLAYKSYGLYLAKKFNNFWDLVNGKSSISTAQRQSLAFDPDSK